MRKNRDDADDQAKKMSEKLSQLRLELKNSHEVKILNSWFPARKNFIILKLTYKLKKHRERANDNRLEELKSKYLQLDTRYKQKNDEVNQLIESLKLVEVETAKKLDLYRDGSKNVTKK